MPNPAIPADIEARWRPLTEQERMLAATYLDDAWWLMLARRPTLEVDLESGTVLAGNVIRVLAGMVRRVLLNPEGKSEESIDDYRYRRDALVSSGVLHVTDDELAAVTPLSSRRRVDSVRLVVYGDG